MSKYTPGPWRYKPHSVDSNYMLIFCSSNEGEGDNLRGYCGEPNARLIAAAPDLLEVVQKYLAWSAAENDHKDTTFWERVEMCREVDQLARAAIAKAEGA